ncbi:MAG: glycosyltransferase family 2 protein [Puniceicoccales bacterium]|jgi:glycosyltransferase involved in cell wall biosynthesis|nr:glycosyltransferase family 2 protein [Puniceicoccales bacterium]
MNSKLFAFPNSQTFPLHEEDEASVAILMRTKDRPILLPRGLSSVINQNFTDWHLFLINDSEDTETVDQVLLPYKAKLKGKLTIVDNGRLLGEDGLSLERERPLNAGIKAVLKANNNKTTQQRFAYFVVHDDDDAWHPSFLQETVTFLEQDENTQYAGVCTSVTMIEEEIKDGKVHYLKEYPWKPHVKAVSFWELMKTNQIVPIASFFRIELFERIGVFNHGMPVYDDWDFALRALSCADIGFIEKPLAYYHKRVRNESLGSASANTASATFGFWNRKYENAILREAIKDGPGNYGTLFAMANFEKRMQFEFSKVNQKNEELKKMISMNARTNSSANIGASQKKEKSFLKKIDSFFYQNLFRHILKLFNIPKPPPEKRKSFLNRLDSCLYQVIFKHILKIFGK